MSKFPFLYDNNGNIKYKNRVSSLYELNLTDTSQLSLSEREDHYSSVKNLLLNLPSGGLFNIYKSKHNLYLNSPFDVDSLDIDSLVKGKARGKKFRDVYELSIDSDISIEDGIASIGGELWAFIKVDSFPDIIDSSFIEFFPCDYKLTLYKSNEVNSKMVVRNKKITSIEHTRKYHQDLQAEKEYIESQKVGDLLDDGTDSLFRFDLTFLVRGLDRQVLLHELQRVSDLLKRRKVKFHKVNYSVDLVLTSFLLGNFKMPLSTRYEGVNYISNLFNFSKHEIHSDGIYFDTVDGYGVRVDLFDANEVNPHAYITGATGTGKSNFALNYVSRYVEKYDANLVFIDLGGGGRRVVKYLGGEVFSDYIDLFKFGGDAEFIYQSILPLIKDEYSKSDLGLIYEKIESYCSKGLEDFEELIELINVELNGFKYLFSRFNKFFKSSDAGIPNICYIDTESIPTDLLDTYLIYIRKLVTNLNGKTFIVWDECWDIAAKAPDSIRFSLKTDRKKNISNILINQELKTLGEGLEDLDEVIRSNINFKFIFNQGDISSILNDKQNLLYPYTQTVKGWFSRCLVSSENINKLIDVKFDQLFYELALTEREKWEKQNKFIEDHTRYLDFKSAFNKYMDYKYGAADA